MRLSLQTVLEELQRLKLAGQSSVSVSEESLHRLKEAVARRAVATPAPSSPPAGTQGTGFPPADSARAQSFSSSSSGQPGGKAPPQPDGGVNAIEAYLSGGNKGPASPGPAKPARSEAPAAPRVPAPVLSLPETDKAGQLQWLRDALEQDPVIRAFMGDLRTRVPGTGNLDARIVFTLETPLAEDLAGTGAVEGSACDLLNRMIQAMGLKREDVYITSLLPWRPAPGPSELALGKDTRDPSAQELAYCLPYYQAQLRIVSPLAVVAFGSICAKQVLGKGFKTLFEARGQWHEHAGFPLMVSYSPNYVLHKAKEGKAAEKKVKRQVWEDLLKVMEKTELPISERQRNYFA